MIPFDGQFAQTYVYPFALGAYNAQTPPPGYTPGLASWNAHHPQPGGALVGKTV